MKKSISLTIYERYGARHEEKLSENVRMGCNITHGCETWTVSTTEKKKLEAFVKCAATEKRSRFHGVRE